MPCEVIPLTLKVTFDLRNVAKNIEKPKNITGNHPNLETNVKVVCHHYFILGRGHCPFDVYNMPCVDAGCLYKLCHDMVEVANGNRIMAANP